VTRDGAKATSLRQDSRLLIRLMRRTDGRRMGMVIALGIVLALTEGVTLLLLVPILKGLQGDGVDTSGWPVIGGRTQNVPLTAVLALLVGTVAVRGVVSVFRDRVVARLRLEVLDRQRLAALDAALNARWSWLLSRRGSDIVQTVNTEVARVGFTVDLFARLTVGVFMAIAITITAIIVAPVVGTIAAALAALAALLLLPTARTAHRLGRDQVAANRDYAAAVTDAVGSIKLVRAHESANRWLTLLRGTMAEMAKVQVQFATRTSMQQAAVTFGSALAASVLVLIALKVGVSANQLIVLVVLVSRLLATVQGLGQTAQQAANFLPAVATVHELLEEAGRHADPTRGIEIGEPRALPDGPLEVVLDRIAFAYPDTTTDVLDDVTLVCAAGRITAVSGPSGVGKSTLVDVVLGLLSPQAGTVSVGGAATTPAVLREFRSRLGYVPQDVHMLPGTLRENLTWSTDHPTIDDDAWRALDRACAEFARDLPNGLDTLLGERGVRLSGGQRQRIALARALLRGPDLLVLDEATSALDPETEERVLESIKRLGTTVLLVAHRESTLSYADTVLRLDAAAARN
jgi:ATP-binding cassette subfamily C protein